MCVFYMQCVRHAERKCSHKKLLSLPACSLVPLPECPPCWCVHTLLQSRRRLHPRRARWWGSHSLLGPPSQCRITQQLRPWRTPAV